jgi:hypothetical protein
MSFRFDVKVIKIPTKPIVILAKEIVVHCTKVQNFNNKKLVYLGLVKMLFSLIKRKVAFYFKMRFNWTNEFW